MSGEISTMNAQIVRSFAALAWLALGACALGCSGKPVTYETKVQVVQVQRFGSQGGPGLMDLELKFSDCPGDARRVVRADKTFTQCAIKPDPKEEANYELVQVCTDLQATGVTVGVHCDRTRPKELVAKCPWLRRN